MATPWCSSSVLGALGSLVLPQEITLSPAVAGHRLAVQSTLYPTAGSALQPFGSDLQHRLSMNNCTELYLSLLQGWDSLQHPPVPTESVHRVQLQLLLSWVASSQQEDAHWYLQSHSQLHHQVLVELGLHGLSVQIKAIFLKNRCYLCF